MVNYEIVEMETGAKAVKKTTDDGREWWIPFDENNSDYQRYLRWLENPDADESGTL